MLRALVDRMLDHALYTLLLAIAVSPFLIFGLMMVDECNRIWASGEDIVLQDHQRILGVELGMSEHEARAALRRHGFQTSDGWADVFCGRAAAAGERILFLRDESWRRGSVCLRSVDERVGSMDVGMPGPRLFI